MYCKILSGNNIVPKDIFLDIKFGFGQHCASIHHICRFIYAIEALLANNVTRYDC